MYNSLGDNMKKLLLITTGGTIASVQMGKGLEPALNSRQLLDRVSEIENFCSVECLELFNLDSVELGSKHWQAVSAEIEKNYQSYDGFVVTCGTDAMSYCAAALSYLIQNSPKPVVITGAQYPFGAVNSDAKANLFDAFLTAASDANGVSVVFGGKIISGVCAVKVDTRSLCAFESVNRPLIGTVQNGKAVITAPHKFNGDLKFEKAVNGKVGVLIITPEMPAELISAAAKAVRGLVVCSLGSGGIPSYCFDALKTASKDTLIAVVTQCRFGETDLAIYRTGVEAQSAFSPLTAGKMTVEHTVIRLAYALSDNRELDKAAEIFKSDINLSLTDTE